jgi:ribonuclease R
MNKPKAPRPERKPDKKSALPSRDELLAFVASHPGAASKRDLARHFGIKGNDKIELKRLLRELQEEGTVKRGRGKAFTKRGDLPEVTAVEVVDRDPDGELICRPVQWDGDGNPPLIMLAPGPHGEGSHRALGIGERFLARLTRTADGYEARVIKRLGASAHKALGVFRKLGKQGRIEPVDRKAKQEFAVAEGDTGGAVDGELVLAEPMPGRVTGLPRARILERLGNVSSPRAISLIAIHAHSIPDTFPVAAIDEAKRAKPAQLAGRTDLRSIPLVTIDPPDARDHDDAVWAAPDDDPKNKGGFRAVVAIADVAHYVTPGSALDREALRRGNSCYFPDRVVPMLPEELSADLCSLKEKVDRAVLAAHLTFDAGGRLKQHRIERGLMRSAAKLSYAEVQDALDGRPNDKTKPLLDAVLKPLAACYRAMAKARDQRGPLDLDLPEHKIQLGPDGRVSAIAVRERLETHRLIEEFMIQANVAAAETLEAKRTPLIFRIHAPPAPEKLNALSDFLSTLKISFAKGQIVKPAMLNRILDTVRGGPYASMVNEIMLRTQSQAEYNPDNIGHFGLALRRYAHFTSPIRRYADLVVHRALIRALRLGDGGLTEGEVERLDQTAEEISAFERRAMAAERDSNDRYIAAYMSDRIGAEFAGRISGVTRFGLFVRLSETGADGLIPVRSLGREFFQHDERAHALVGERSGLTFRLGTKVTVRLAEAAPLTGGLRFDLIEGGEPGTPRPPLRGPRRPPGRGRR